MSARTALAPASPPPDPQLDAAIRAEQVSMLYRQLPTSIAGNMTGALLLAGLLLFAQPPGLIALWLTCMTALQALRLGLYFRHKRTGSVPKDLGRAAALWACGAGFSGVFWGATALLFFVSGDPVYQAVLTILVFGLTAAAVPLIGSHIPSFYAFVFPALVPFIARNAYEADAPHFALSFTAFAVLLGLLSLARNYNRMLTTSLRNRFEKEALAERLAAQNLDLEEARVAAEQANRSKTQFFAAASHDLRQPLHAMGLFASALAHKVRDPEVIGVVGSINASVHALEALFNELLDISKIDSGAIKLELTHFALNAVFDRLRDEFDTEAQAKGLRLSIASTEHVVHSDAMLLERILRNLISNAIRYTHTGEVAVTAAPSSGMLEIAVRDTGIGINKTDQQQIFEEFVQLANPGRTSKKGLGLGLSIVQRLCGLLGHPIRLSSEYGKGSTFSFEVPLGIAPEPQEDAFDKDLPVQTDLGGKLVVVIDDEATIVDGMQVLLSSWGATVLGSSDGDDIVTSVHEIGRLPDLIIVDYRLAGSESGIEVAQRLRRELDPEIPALLVTGSITPDLAEQAAAVGLDFLLKPVTAPQLREHINAALNLRLIETDGRYAGMKPEVS